MCVVVCSKDGVEEHLLKKLDSVSANAMTIVSDTAVSLWQEKLAEKATRLFDDFYRCHIKKSKRNLSAKAASFLAPWMATVHYHFKIAAMCEFLSDMSAALKAYNAAHTAIVDHARRIPSTDLRAFLADVRLITDLLVVKVTTLLVSITHETHEADDYLQDHLRMFATALEMPLGWRCKMYAQHAEMMVASKRTSEETRNAGYYYYLAARNALSAAAFAELHQSVQLQSLATELLSKALDWYQRQHVHRMSLHIQRLLVNQQVFKGHPDEAVNTLLRLRKAYLADAWPSLAADVLSNLFALTAKPEFVWEMTSLDPEAHVDLFEACFTEHLSTADCTLDLGQMCNTLLQCAFAFAKQRSVAGQGIDSEFVLCNMTPISWTVHRIVLHFDQHVVHEVNVPYGLELVPGSVTGLPVLIDVAQPTTLALTTVNIDLECGSSNKLHLWIPAKGLDTRESLLACRFGSPLYNPSFHKRISSYTPESKTHVVERIKPVLELQLAVCSPLVAEAAVMLRATIANKSAMPVVCTCVLRSERLSFKHDPSRMTLLLAAAETSLIDFQACKHGAGTALLALEVEARFEGNELGLSVEPVVFALEELLSFNEVVLNASVRPVPTDVAMNWVSGEMPVLLDWVVECEVLCEEHAFPGLQINGFILYDRDTGQVFDEAGPGAVDVKRTFVIRGSTISGSTLATSPMLRMEWTFAIDGYEHISNTTLSLSPIAPSLSNILVLPRIATPLLLGCASSCRWTIWNPGPQPCCVNVGLDVGDSFVYAGPSLTDVTVAPQEGVSLAGWIVPLKLGVAAMPSVSIRPARAGESVYFECLPHVPLVVSRKTTG